MEYLKLNENVCRICLESNVTLNWNDEIFVSCGMTYKDCYYKYTQLSENDSGCYPTHLCMNCSSGLKNAHMLLEKALESYNILRSALDDKYILPDEKIEIESHIYVNERITKTEILESSLEEISINDDVEIEPALFLEQELVETSNTESTSNKTVKKRKRSKASHSKLSITKKIDNGIENFSLAETSDNDSESLELSTKKVSRTQKLSTDRSKSCDTKPTTSKLTEHKQTRRKLCQYCSRKVHESRLKSHEATHNENRQRNATCPECGIKLFDKFSLHQHMKIHSANRQKDHKCEFCEKAFFNKGALNVHRRVHLGLMVKCQICSKEYYRQVDLNRHLVTHSAIPPQKSGEKVKYTIQCQYCNKNISTNSWREHKAAHLNQPQTKCKICDKDFFSRSSVRHHLKKVHHTREFDKYIYHHGDPNTRMSHLIMVQQEKVQPLTE